MRKEMPNLSGVSGQLRYSRRTTRGHATLASAFVILNFYEPDSEAVQFSTLSGVLIVKWNKNLYEMNFPTYELNEIPVTDAMEKAFGVRPTKAILGLDLICVFESEEQVRNINPDQALLTKIEGRISISGEAVLVAKLEIAVQ